MTTGKVKKKQSLADQLAELSNPTPVTFHPDQEDLEDVTAAKVCSFDGEEESREDQEEEEGRGGAVRLGGRGRRRRVKYLDEDDAKYAGKVVSRKALEAEYDAPRAVTESDQDDSGSESLDESEGEESLTGDDDSSRSSAANEDTMDQSDEDISSSQSGSEFSDSEAGSTSPTESTAEGDDITVMSLASLREDLEKGKAAQEQVSLFDGALESRIRLQKLLTLCNRLPQPAAMSQFQQAGGQQLEQSLKQTQVRLRGLLDNLLGLQRMILAKNKETSSVVGGAKEGSHGNSVDGSVSDEEIPSDSEEETEKDVGDVISDQSEEEENEQSAITRKRLKRKRKRPDWVTISGRRDYEGYIAKTHESLKSFRDSTVEKWSKRTKIASGKITSKAFLQVDHSVLSQIEHVLKDKERLVKRTQLKRSVYRILGTSKEEDDAANDNEASGNTEEEEKRGQGDTHLHDYDPEIFDDDDFYHQLLRELIERKMSYTEGSDPTAMGRQWLELQKLRNKAKKKVDTKASKGRKIRYDVHPKLSSFMTPINKGSVSDVSRNDLFSSLFGGRYSTMS